MITILCWQWNEPGNRTYTPSHVNVLASMFKRHLTLPHRVVCISDEAGFSGDVCVIPTPAKALELAKLKTLEGAHFPSCFRRLWLFSDEARILGERVLLTDIDVVLTGNIDHLFDAPDEPFIGWRPLARWGDKKRIGGGLYLMRTGAYTEVWNGFRGEESMLEARQAGYRGSDQAWLSYKLADKVPVFGDDSGLYSIRDLADGRKPLPTDACLVQFNGVKKPWQSNLSWVKENWR